MVFVCRRIKKNNNILIKTFSQVTKDQHIIALTEGFRGFFLHVQIHAIT